ncbi:alpha-ketoglutarate-dependent taurine dioxygenase [Mucidula mucida]|nr:alpha-ketoglutarate-dependent taurine dioxygenase [Mucidula mucida]
MSATTTVRVSETEPVVTYDINIPYKSEDGKFPPNIKYPAYAPTWDPIWFGPLPPFEFEDPALRADKAKPSLLSQVTAVEEITPRMGTVLRGVQLTSLTDAAKDELALLVSERKIVAFPDQDFIDAGPEYQQAFMDYFGKRNYQPVSGSVKGYPGFHIIHRDGNKEEIDAFFQQKATSCLWHQDVSYECQPPGYVMLGLLDGPKVGGDTIFAAADDAYDRLSPKFRAFIDTLFVKHSSANMIKHTRLAGGLVRKDPVTNVHPLVRVHPVTGRRSIFLNGEFITGIEDMKELEGRRLQTRVRWSPKTIVMFDNRSTIHTASVDYIDEEHGAQARHIFRLAAMAEKPVPVPV